MSRGLLSLALRRSKRVYILPTKMGGYLNGLIFLLFLLSVGYSNNLLLIFTLFLFGLNLLWVIQTHAHLNALRLERAQFSDGHANAKASFLLRFARVPKGPTDFIFTLECLEGALALDGARLEDQEVRGSLSWPRRGRWTWRYLRISSERPMGLYRAWRYLPLDGQSLAYPALQTGVGLPALMARKSSGEEGEQYRGEGDFLELLPYFGEEVRKISWKHYARTGELLVREGEEQRSPLARLKLVAFPTEEVLSHLASQMVACHREGIPFSFEREGGTRGPSETKQHLKACLEELGRW